MGFSSGGAEMLVRNLSTAFVERGHTCHIIAVANSEALGNSATFEAGFKEDLSRHRIGFEVLGASTRRSPIHGAFRLRKAMKAFKPDILHVHTGHGLLFQAIGALRLPTVYTHHNIRLNFPPFLFKVFDTFVDRYVAICGACEQLLESHVRRPVDFVFNGVPKHFSPAGPRTEPARDPIVLSVGAVTDQKDYPTLVRSAAFCVRRFEQEGRRIRFQIAGSGPQLADLRQVVVDEGMEEHVELLGTRSDVSQLMAKADLLVNSSIYEGLPIALIEAAMSALPVVATEVGGNPEVVIDGRTGLLVKAREPEALADAIFALLSDPQRYASFSKAALDQSRKFTIDGCAEAHLNLYSNILKAAA